MVPNNLKIKDPKLKSCLDTIKQNVIELWDNPLIDHYTDHGPKHSKRVIEILSNLLEDKSKILNDSERFILLASAYLHDIGMQAPRYAGVERSNRDYTFEDKEKIRCVHNDISAKIIENCVSGKPICLEKDRELKLGFELCSEFTNSVAKVSKYHRSLDLTMLEDTSIGGKKIKLTLLAALLRLGDELDADYRRVNMKRLKLRDIPPESKFHWWGHYYVKSVLIEGGKIKIFFRFPEMYRTNEDVTNPFLQRTCRSIKKQLAEVYDILFRNDIKLYREPEYVIEYEKSLEPIPEKLSDYIYDNVLETCEGLIVNASLEENIFSLHKYKSDFDKSDVNLQLFKNSDFIKFESYDTPYSPIYLFTTFPVKCILPINIEKNIQWSDEEELSNGISVKANSKISSIDERVEVPKRTFESCIRIDTTFDIPATANKTPYKIKSIWWKESVGPVQIVVEFEDSKRCIGKLIDYKVNNNDNEFWPLCEGNFWVYRWKLERDNNSHNFYGGISHHPPDIEKRYSSHADTA